MSRLGGSEPPRRLVPRDGLFPFLSHLAVTDSCVCRSCADHPCLPSIPPEETLAVGSPVLGTFDSMPFLYAVKPLLLLECIGSLRRAYG